MMPRAISLLVPKGVSLAGSLGGNLCYAHDGELPGDDASRRYERKILFEPLK